METNKWMDNYYFRPYLTINKKTNKSSNSKYIFILNNRLESTKRI